METVDPFKVGRNVIFKTLICIPSYGWMLWSILAAGVILCIVGCFTDLRFLILGLIFCLTLFPAVAFFFSVKYLLAAGIVPNLLYHTVEQTPDGYLVDIYRPANQDNPEEDEKDWIHSEKITLYDSNVTDIKTTNEYEVVSLKDSPLNILFIPRY